MNIQIHNCSKHITNFQILQITLKYTQMNKTNAVIKTNYILVNQNGEYK